MSLIDYIIKRDPDKTFFQEFKELSAELKMGIKEELSFFRNLVNLPYNEVFKYLKFKKNSNKVEDRSVRDVLYYMNNLK